MLSVLTVNYSASANAKAYSNLQEKAFKLEDSGDFVAAMEVYEEMLSFVPERGRTFLYLARANTLIGKLEAARSLYDSCLAYIKEKELRNYALINQSNNFYLLSEYEKAIAVGNIVYRDKQAGIYPRATALNNIAISRIELGQYIQARKNLKESIWAKEHLGLPASNGYANIALSYDKEGKLDSAGYYHHKAFIKMPDEKAFRNYINYLLYKKDLQNAAMFISLYEGILEGKHNTRLNLYKAELAYLIGEKQEAMILWEKIENDDQATDFDRIEAEMWRGRLSNSEVSFSYYDEAIDMILANKAKMKTLDGRRSNSAMLSSIAKEAAVKAYALGDEEKFTEYANLSKSAALKQYQEENLNPEAKRLRQKIASYERLISEATDMDVINNLTEEQLKLMEQIPQAEERTTSLEEIREGLPRGKAFVEFLWADTAIIAATVEKSKVSVASVKIGDSFKSQLGYAINELHNVNGGLTDFEEFKGSLRYLHGILVDSLIQTDKGLIISPDGLLSYLPFECLLVSDEGMNYQKLDYLIHHRDIQYTFTKPEKGKLNKSLSMLLPENVSRRKSVILASSLKGELLEPNKASLEGLGGVLHISAHGKKSPKGHFFEFNDSLYIRELQEYNLNLDLAVLGSCNSGYGEYMEGEGVGGIDRAMMYAGTKAVVTSLWAAEDNASAFIFKEFYKNLGNPAKSLNEAKRRYIKSSPDAHPKLWANYTYAGLAYGNQNRNIWIVLVSLLAVAGLWHFYKRKVGR